MGQLLGFPACCIAFFRRVWVNDGCVDTTWAMAANSGSASEDGRLIEVESSTPFQANILWRWMGVRAVPHLPCSFACPHTVDFANRLMGLGRDLGFADEMEWIEEILNWPASWSALHGIAQVKTPVLKVSTRTDATAHEFVVRRAGRRMPDEAPPASSFRSARPRSTGPDAVGGVRARARGADCALHRAAELVCVGQRLQFGDGDGRGAPANRGAGARVDWRDRHGARPRVRQRRAAQEDLRAEAEPDPVRPGPRGGEAGARPVAPAVICGQLRRRQHVRRHSARRRHGLQPRPADARPPARSRRGVGGATESRCCADTSSICSSTRTANGSRGTAGSRGWRPRRD